MKRWSVLAQLVLFCLIFVSPTHAALVIEPALIKLELSQQRSSGSFIIKNPGDKEERYRAKAVHFVLTPDGGLREISPDEYSLSSWIKFNPKEFVLPPKSSRVVRFSVIPEGKLRPREYWGAIQFMPLQAAKISTIYDKGRSFNLQVLSVILVPIYGFVDGTQYSGTIKDLSLHKNKDKQAVICSFGNTGEGILRMAGRCQIIDSSGAVVEEIPMQNVAVFTRSERRMKLTLKKPLGPGNYRARVEMKSIDPHFNIELSKESGFTV